MQCSPARRRQGELLASAIVGQSDQAGPGERSDELGGGGPRDAGAARKVGAPRESEGHIHPRHTRPMPAG
jgi:hypothetical protein